MVQDHNKLNVVLLCPFRKGQISVGLVPECSPSCCS